jgi:hypothetical protein
VNTDDGGDDVDDITELASSNVHSKYVDRSLVTTAAAARTTTRTLPADRFPSSVKHM